MIHFQLAHLHADGKKVDGEYVCIPPEICEGSVSSLEIRPSSRLTYFTAKF